MNPSHVEVSTSQRPDGTFAATVDPAFRPTSTLSSETCDHRHATAKSAEACGNWEARAIVRGETRWHAPKDPTARQRRSPSFASLRIADPSGERATAEDLASSHEYVPMPELLALEHAVATGLRVRPGANLLFIGPSGSGKTDGARDFAARIGADFTKVDAASMTDPEGWFGTREIVVSDGLAVTSYNPSSFVESVQRPGITFIDEINRVRDEHRQVLLPLLDSTRAVTNPLTGEIVRRHPQNVIIMAGNVGLQFTGTSAIDPAFMTRAVVVEFDYIDAEHETKIVQDASGCDLETATVLVRFASETRAKAKNSDEFLPISTRELIEAGRLVVDGLSRDLAVKFVVLNGASAEGGSASIRQELQNLWNGVRTMKLQEPGSGWKCPVHGRAKIIPAGVSTKTGRPYSSFRACAISGCQNTEDRSSSIAPVNGVVLCPTCNDPQPAGSRNAYCVGCGGSLV